jgi:hypothetical protein
MKRAVTSSALCLALVGALGLAACQGCRTPEAESAVAPAESEQPTLRLFVTSTVAGALEPCGCSKDQLGGMDHLAAYVEAQRSAAKASLVVGAGPMLFADPKLEADKSTQSTWKAEAIAAGAKAIGLTAWAPGANDWAAGGEALAKYREQTGAALLAANLDGAGALPSKVVEAGGVKVGLVGVSEPAVAGGPYPEGVRAAAPPEKALRDAIAAVKKAGATIFVGLAALPRGEALRLADAVPELHVLVVGKPSERGDGNDAPKSPMLVGSMLVVETSNHLQNVAVVDLFVKGNAEGPITFADAGGVQKAEELLSLTQRIRDLENRVNAWEKDKTVKPEDVAARKADLAKLRDDKAKLEAAQPPVAGSYFRYRAVEVREGLGVSERVASEMTSYYKRVNEHNKVAFADRKPEPAGDGQASFLGVEACTACHDEERKVWDATAHARAYGTLQGGFKEFNLECVSCHVTGYGKPGGATVTWNDRLQNVQCEECHGPGLLHVQAPTKKGLIVRMPDPQTCVTACHHPPHVEGFDPIAQMKHVLGPGHGM